MADILESTEIAQIVVDLASDKLAEDIVLLDLRKIASFADYFVIMSAQSSRQIEGLEEDLTDAEICHSASKNTSPPIQRETWREERCFGH